MKHLNFLLKSGSQSRSHNIVTLCTTVGSPSAHRRGTMLKHLAVLVLILTLGFGQMWATDASITSFTALSGSIDSNISYSSAKGNGTNDPILSSNWLRIYKPASGKSDGGYITVTAANGYEITSITFTNANDKATAYKYSVDGGSLSSSTSIAKSGTFTYNTTTFSTINFYNSGSDRLSVASIAVTYQATGGGGGGSNNPTLSSIQVSGTPSKKTYEQGQSFDPAGLTVTAYYDDDSNAEVTEDVEWSFDPAIFTEAGSNKSVTVTASYEDIEDGETYDDITVTEHVVTPGEYAISLNNVLYGTTAGANITVSSVSATKNDITIVSGATSGTKPRTDAACIRYYQNNYLTFSVPTGYQITSIAFAEPSSDKTWNGSITVDAGTYTNDTKSWEGKANSVTFSFALQNRIASATISYEAACTELGQIKGSVF